MDTCDTEVLQNYLGGSLSPGEIERCERHLLNCDSCRKELAVLILILDENLSVEETLLVDSAEATLSKPILSPDSPVREDGKLKVRWWILPKWGLVAVACLIVLTTGALLRRGGDPAARLVPSERTLEARLSGQPYSEFVRSRSFQQSSDPERETQVKRLGGSDLELGQFYLRQHDFTQAIAHLELARKQQPSSPQVHNDLGVAYMESLQDGALQKALNEFESALKLDASYEPALFNLALVYERMGQFGEAERRLKLYLQVDPSSGWAKEVRSKL